MAHDQRQRTLPAQRLQLGGGNVPEALANEVLNFTDKLLVQSHMDAAECMRGQAIATIPQPLRFLWAEIASII